MINVEIKQDKVSLEMKGSRFDLMAELALCVNSIIDSIKKIEEKDDFAFSVILGIIESIGIEKLEQLIKKYKDIDKNKSLFEKLFKEVINDKIK